MNRRTLLKLLALQAVAIPLGIQGKTLEVAHKHLILIELKGGNDGLNTFVPYTDPLYYQLRPKIAIPREEILPLNGTLGLHPSLADIKEVFESGDMALIQGIGYPHPNRSHFRSIEIWDTASKSIEYLDDGWLRSLEPKKRLELQGIVLGGELGPLSGSERGIIKINNIQGFLNQAKRIRGQIYMIGENKALQHLLKTEAEIRQSADILSRYFTKEKTPDYPFPKTAFGRQLQIAEQLIGSNIDIPYFKLSLGSFDTHFTQAKKHARLLKELSEGIGALRKNLIESGEWDNTIIMTYSEFGRRVAENASNGTDHGTAATQMIIGGNVKGGIYGKQPRLDTLDKNGDLIYTTDFRSFYNTIAKEWVGSTTKQIEGFHTLPIWK